MACVARSVPVTMAASSRLIRDACAPLLAPASSGADGVVDRRELGLVRLGLGDLRTHLLRRVDLGRGLRLHQGAQPLQLGHGVGRLIRSTRRSRAAQARANMLLDAEDLALDRHGHTRCRALSASTLKIVLIALSLEQPLVSRFETCG